MNTTQSMVALVAALGLMTLASPAAAQHNSTPGTKLQRSDRNFIVKAAEGGQAEVELGRLAESKGSSNAVKQFGQRMVEDHGNANKELMELASNKGVQLLLAGDEIQFSRATSPP
jgi:putative membrane protein